MFLKILEEEIKNTRRRKRKKKKGEVASRLFLCTAGKCFYILSILGLILIFLRKKVYLGIRTLKHEVLKSHEDVSNISLGSLI